MSLQIPKTRDYHDENGHPSYPQSLDRAVRSERAPTLAVTPTGPLKRSAVSVRRSPATIAAPFHAMRLNRMFSPWPAPPGKSF